MIDKPYLIYHRRPYRCLLLLLLAILLTTAALWLFSQQWRQQQTAQLMSLQQQYDTLLAENDRLNSSNQMLAIEQATHEQLQTTIQTLQNKVMELKKELLFYQNITQGTASSELQIRELHLRPAQDSTANWLYRIVLTQGERVTKPLEGEVDVIVNLDANEKEPKQLPIKTHEMKIRHVQVIEGLLTQDADTQPVSLQIRIKQDKKILAERTFDWSETVSSEP